MAVPEHIRRLTLSGNKTNFGLLEQESSVKNALADILTFEVQEDSGL